MSTRPVMVDKSRLQIDLSTEQMATLDQMMRDCGLSTKKDLFNNAVTLLEWAVEQVKEGNTIAAVVQDQDRYVELHMPVLSHVARWARKDQRERRSLAPLEPR